MKKITFLNCDIPLCTEAHKHKNFNDNLFVCEIVGALAFKEDPNES